MYVGFHGKRLVMKLEFSRDISEKLSNIMFNENPSRGGRAVPCGQTDGQTDRYDEANSCFFALLRKRVIKRLQNSDTAIGLIDFAL
jgi:hypothetical protein